MYQEYDYCYASDKYIEALAFQVHSWFSFSVMVTELFLSLCSQIK